MIGHVLERDGCVVEAVEDGSKAIERIESDCFDAILLDFMMPVASGFDVIDWIERNRPEVAKSCVIIITAAIQQLRGYDTSKVYATVAKPFDVFQLRDIVRRCIDDKSGKS